MEKKVVLDKTGFWSYVEKQATDLVSSTEKYLAKTIDSEASEAIGNGTDELLKQFKKNVTVTALNGSTATANFPDEVYEAVMSQIIEVEAPKISGSAPDVVNAISRYVSDLLNSNTQTVTVNGTKYTISSYVGSTTELVTVKANNVDYVFNWSGSSTTMKSYQTFMNELVEFGKETANQVYAAIQKDVEELVTGTSGLISILVKARLYLDKDINYYAAREFFDNLKPYIEFEQETTDFGNEIVKILKDVYDNISSLSDVELDKQAKKLIKKLFPDASSIGDKYDAAVSAYDSFSSYIAGNNVTAESIANAKAYKDFVSAYNDLESAVGQSKTAFGALLESYTINQFSDVQDEDIGDNHASISGTAQGDRISSYGTNATVNGNDGDDILAAHGNNTRLYGGNGADKFLSYSSNVTVYGEAGVDIIGIVESASKNIVYGGIDNDSIAVEGSSNTIHGDDGNDIIIVSAASNIAYGDNGDDIMFLETLANGNTVSGGAGNDWIRVDNNANNNTIIGGEGNDTISLDSAATDIINYDAGDGNDTIIGFNEDDALYLLKLFTKDYTTETVGNDVIVHVSDNFITLKDTAGKKLNIQKLGDLSGIIKQLESTGGGSDTNTDTSVITDTSVYVISGDNITNDSDNVILNAQGSSTTIRNAGYDVKINGSSNDDVLYNEWYGNSGGDRVTIEGNNGNDAIRNYNSSYVNIDGGNGNDSIWNSGDGSDITVNGGSGKDYINNYVKNITINGGMDNDTISNSGENVKIYSGDGNDSVHSSGNQVNIDGGDGEDYIGNYGSNVTINGGSGNDYFRIGWYYENVTINGGDGADTIENGDFVYYGNYTEPEAQLYHSGSVNLLIYGDADNDYINSAGDNVTINGGDANDTVTCWGNNVIVHGDAGDDSIYSTGDSVAMYGEGGNDYIKNGGYIQKGGNDVTVNGGDGNDTIYNHGDNASLLGEEGADSIRSDGNYITILGGSGNDTILAQEDYVTVYGGNGDDYIDVGYGYQDGGIVVSGQNGNDTIFNSGNNAKIFGGNGNDYISSSGDNVTINGGLGDDTIELNDSGSYNRSNKMLFRYTNGDGNDVIDRVYDECTIEIVGSSYITMKSGRYDVIIKVGDGSIKVNNGIYYDFNIVEGIPTNDDYMFSNYIGDNSNDGNQAVSYEPIQKSSDTYDYTGGNKVISDYSSDSKIQLPETLSNVEVASDSLVVKASTGDLVIENVVDKVIEFTDKDGNTTAYAYIASDNKTVDGSSLDKFEVIVGAETVSNNLIAGSGGSSLIGGGGNNTLQGGAGRDAFVYSSGNNVVKNYESGDVVHMAHSYDSIDVSENNLIIKSTAGDLTIENVKEKVVDVTNTDGTLTQIYVARESGGEVAGNALGNSPEIFKIIVGAEDNKNHLIAGDGGSSLIGGKTDDILQGGIGHDAFSYSSGNDTITNYESSEEITFDGTYQNWITDGNDFVLNAAEGSLRITDAREKLIRVKNLDGSILMGVYMSDEEDVYDYSNYGEFITAIGSNNQRNTLIAGSAGSVLWGGDGKAWDEMYGGAGADEFVYKYGNGADAIFNASYEDTVNLSDITFDQIVGAKLIPNRATFVFTDYGSLNILGQAGNFVIGGQNYNADYNNNQLQAK